MLCSVKLDTRWLLVNVRLVLDSTSVLNSCNLTPNFLPVSPTALVTRHFAVVSRIGRTEYQLLLTKASDRGRNVKFLRNYLGCV